MNANVVYSITCNTCREEGEESTYWGETARAPYWRGVEHMTAYNKGGEGSHMNRHMMERHPETNLKTAEAMFRMEIYKKFQKSMERQLFEALKIARAGGLESPGIMNAKEEYNCCVVPEVTTSIPSL